MALTRVGAQRGTRFPWSFRDIARHAGCSSFLPCVARSFGSSSPARRLSLSPLPHVAAPPPEPPAVTEEPRALEALAVRAGRPPPAVVAHRVGAREAPRAHRLGACRSRRRPPTSTRTFALRSSPARRRVAARRAAGWSRSRACPRAALLSMRATPARTEASAATRTRAGRCATPALRRARTSSSASATCSPSTAVLACWSRAAGAGSDARLVPLRLSQVVAVSRAATSLGFSERRVR